MDQIKVSDIDSLIMRCRQHDDEAFDELVNRYTPMIRKVISGFCSGYDYSELFSESCVALHTATQRFDMEQSEVTFGLYARICVRNRILDLLRIKDGRAVSELDVEQVLSEDDPEDKIVERETFDSILKSARVILSDYEYRVLLLHIQGYKTATIAEMLCRSAKSVDNAKSRLFKRLRSEFGGIAEK